MFMNACSNIFLKHILQQFKSTLVITTNVIYLSIYAPKEKKAAHSVAVSFIALCGACACDELSASWLRAGKHAPAATAREAGFSISETEKQLQLFLRMSASGVYYTTVFKATEYWCLEENGKSPVLLGNMTYTAKTSSFIRT